MKLFHILIVTMILLAAASGGEPQSANARMDHGGRSEAEANTGLRIRLDFNPASFSGSILFERDLQGGDDHHTISLNVVHIEETESPSITRSIRDRFKAMQIITRVALRLMSRTVSTLL
jgi:hypothetical protein